MNKWKLWRREMLIAVPMIVLGAVIVAWVTDDHSGVVDYTIGVFIGGAVGVYRGIEIALKEHSQSYHPRSTGG